MSILFNNGQGYGINPTTTFIPYNNNGNFADSNLRYDSLNNSLTTFNVATNYNEGLGVYLNAKIVFIGDLDSSFGGFGVNIDYGNKIFNTKFTPFWKGGISINNNSRLYELGDFELRYNSTFFKVDDQNQRIEFSTNLRAATAGAASGQFLKVRVAGVDYKLSLLNP